MNSNNKGNENELNINAQEYKPKKKSQLNQPKINDKEKGNEIPPKLNLNLDAKEFISKQVELVEAEEDEVCQEEIDKMMEDEIENQCMEELDSEEDEDKWYPQYKDCSCCKGFVYNCKGQVCKDLGQCYCKMKDDCDNKGEENKDIN